MRLFRRRRPAPPRPPVVLRDLLRVNAARFLDGDESAATHGIEALQAIRPTVPYGDAVSVFLGVVDAVKVARVKEAERVDAARVLDEVLTAACRVEVPRQETQTVEVVTRDGAK